MSQTTQPPRRIHKILAVPAIGAGYYEDLAALQENYVALPERFTAPPVTPGFRAVREVAEAVSVGLQLDDGQVAWGDCVAVSYSARSGRAPLFRTAEGLATIEEVVTPLLQGQALVGFRDLAAEVEGLTEAAQVSTSARAKPKPETQPARGEGVSRRALLTAPARALRAAVPEPEGSQEEAPTEPVTVERQLHTAIRYGVSQALLQAVALARGVTMTQVIADEWDLPLPDQPVPLHAQSGHERYFHAEKMIVHRIASLPHALVDDVRGQVGKEGAELTRYLRWLSQRIGQLGGDESAEPTPSAKPVIHLDLHGALGRLVDNQAGRMLGQLYAWELAAQPYRLRVESPMILDSREAQIEAMKTLRDYVRLRGMKVQLVADEWANTLDDIRAFLEAGAADMIQIKMPDLGGVHNAVDAVLACKAAGAGAFVGGSYAETDLSSRVSVHVALATQADLLMAKPGMGVDEAISLAKNEMGRVLAQIQERE